MSTCYGHHGQFWIRSVKLSNAYMHQGFKPEEFVQDGQILYYGHHGLVVFGTHMLLEFFQFTPPFLLLLLLYSTDLLLSVLAAG